MCCRRRGGDNPLTKK